MNTVKKYSCMKTIWITEEMKIAIDYLASTMGVSISDIFRQAVFNYLDFFSELLYLDKNKLLDKKKENVVW